MARFEVVFKTEPTENIVEIVKEGHIDFDFWGKLDIQIDGQSFFINFRSEYYDKYYEGTSSISNQGISTPVFPMLEAFIKGIVNLKKEKEVVIEEYTGQISKSLVCVDYGNGENIIFAVREGEDFFSEKYIWYDGEKVSIQKEIPISKVNILKKDDFIYGCFESVNEYLSSLIDKYPKLKEIPYFREFVEGTGL
ncbi:hypothetical protein QFZ77_002921 [Paenibacillus sp. V4I3]|uniref:hypothetical protein n=1 Tax=unclassified Paenibacillus TaxID=185978 RepID=UPI002789A1CD|nr:MULTISPECIES: hypothetical protein [unclassified Paenibacillus]MDQ0874262.1 hypothetical protein [Paenibacillus sp. V4I3]MDQ0891382.1 hypothetical protein [Paenibacillus sp. V4I9]